MTKLMAILFLPFLPLAIMADVLIGDLVTGVELPARKKAAEQWRMWIDVYHGAKP